MKFIQILKLVFLNLAVVFKNFFHWTTSRIIIVIFAFFLAVASFIPFFIVLIILGYIDSISWGNMTEAFANGTIGISLLGAFSTAPLFFILESLIAIGGIAFAIGVYHYKNILIYRLIGSYFSEERISLKKTITLKFFKKYLRIFPKIFGYLLLPVLSYLAFAILIFLLFGGMSNTLSIIESSAFNPVSLVLLFGFLINFVLFIYIYYRFIFIYPQLSETADIETGEYFVESRKMTRGKVIFYVLGCVIVYALISLPTSIYEKTMESEPVNVEKYLYFRSLELIPKNESFASYGITQYKNYDEVTLDPSFIMLDQRYKEYEIETLNLIKARSEFISNILFIFNFLIFYGIFEVIIYSLYMSFRQEKSQKKGLIEKLSSLFGKKKIEM